MQRQSKGNPDLLQGFKPSSSPSFEHFLSVSPPREMAKKAEMPSEENMKGLLQSTPKKAIKTSFTIFRSAPSICQNSKELYEPRMVSIGPRHHNSEVTLYMNDHKRQFLCDFLRRNTAVDKEVYMEKIRGLNNDVHKCYSEKVKWGNEVFHPMLLDDGCFILEFLLKLENNEHDALFRAGWDPVLILSDLLLLENQIPFFILEELYAIVVRNNANLPDLRTLVTKNLFTKYLHDGIHTNEIYGPFEETHHLLHLYHQLSKPSRETNTLTSDSPAPRITKKNYNVPQVIPCASQLIEFGMRLRRNISPRDIFHVDFHKGVMKIPQLVIDPTRRTLLMNLLAFEKCVAESERRWTGLMILMNCIMKNKSDLEILQRSGIVLNLFPSEEEAIKFVGQLSERVTIDFNSHYFTDMFGDVNKHCDTKMARYRATFMHQYFNNPWAIISFTSSMVAIFLSSVQTLIAVFSYRNRFHH